MCSIVNLFDTNVRKFDAKKATVFCAECLNSVNHYENLIFYNNKISVLKVELYLKIRSIES